MAYIPSSGSVVGFQSDATKLVATVSVVGTVPPHSVSGVGNFNASVVGTVPVTQTTNPWNVQLTSGSIATTVGNSSVQLVGGTAMVGSVAAYQGATAPWRVELTSGSIATTAGTTGNSSVQLVGGTAMIGSVTAYQGSKPWSVELTSGSVTTTGGNSSVQLVGGTAMVGSIAAYQGSKPWAVELTSGSIATTVGNSSVMLTPGINTIGSVATLQGTNPWFVQLTSGSVITTGGNSSVQVVGLMPPQSVSGVGTFNVITVGSVLTQYREDVVATSVIGYPLVFRRTDSASIMGIVSPANPLPIQGSVATLQSTNPWIVQLTSGSVATTGGNSSVQLVNGTAAIGSVAALQGTNPWVVSGFPTTQNVSGSVFAVGSITALQGTQPWLTQIVSSVATRATPASVQLLGGTNAIGSVATLQGTNPWVIGNSSVTVMNAIPPHSVSGVGLFNVNHIGAGSIITLSTGSVMTTFAATSLISGHASINGAGSVLVLASVQATLYAYVTDFLLSNTGATTTLVKFTDRDGSVMGKSIAPTGGGAVATAITSPMRTLVTGSPVYVGADTATSTLHAWVGGYKGL